ncbi:flagellar basal body-associated FliL family protein [Austwickia chelonae]|uniref:flagellar basal body-associated FliL family protein n=1 Tax=Austwickia chelonae TaxID=100225 RepID=UPI000E28A009|nr:flagellar basal body-associated FliL family protein [Austwickia chelonae]
MSKDQDATPAEGGAAKGGGKKMIIIIAVTALVVMAAAGLVFKMVLGPKEPPKDLTKEPGAVVALPEDMTLNLSDGKYLKMKLALQLSEDATQKAGGEKALKAFDGSKARDAAIGILGHYTMDQLLKPENKEKAQETLTKEVKERYEGKVIKVYFTDFVMQ